MKKSILYFLSAFWFLNLKAQDQADVPNQLIVQLRENKKDFPEYIIVKDLLSRSMRIYLLEKRQGNFSEKEISELKKLPFVEHIQYNHKVQSRNIVPVDSFFYQQWGLLNTGQNGGTPGADISATLAWEINHSNVTTEGDSIVIAIVDDPMFLEHEDIHFFTNYDELNGIPGVDDDGNGYIDDVHGWNAIANTPAQSTLSIQHGTHVAGIAGAIGNNSIGTSGVSWGTKILPVYGSSDDEAVVIRAYDYVMEMRKLYNQTSGTKGAFVVVANSSFGVDNGHPDNFPIWCALYDSLGKLGILSTTATANQNWNIDQVYDIPTACPSDYMISVTNTTRTDTKANSAGYGAVSIDLGAPGSSIYSTTPNNNYGVSTGTSMASPHVAGAVASMFTTACPSLLNSYLTYPDSFALLFKKYLLDGVDHIASLQGKVSSNGRLNLYKALLNVQSYNCNDCNFKIDGTVVQPNCQDSAAGYVEANIGVVTGLVEFEWSSGEQTPIIENKSAGIYTVTATVDGCATQQSFFLDNPKMIVIDSIIVTNGMHCCDHIPATIDVYAHSGNNTVYYSLDSLPYQTSNHFGNLDGEYVLHINNQNGCIIDTTVSAIVHYCTVDDCSGINEIIPYPLQLFPNPAQNSITVSFKQTKNPSMRYMIYDMNGKPIKSDLLTGQEQQISLNEISDGVYLFEARSESGRIFRTRFTVLR